MDFVRQSLTKCGLIVVKIGSSSITYDNGKLNYSSLERLCRVSADLRNQGRQVILVTSGAVAAGVGRLGLDKPPEAIAAKQALAAIGQGILMGTYEKLMSEYGQTVGQVLLTWEDMLDEGRKTNSLNTFCRLLDWGAIPIVNENDTVAVEEIKFGDNDTLSARVAALVGADLLVILTDIEGLFSADPRVDPKARLISTVTEITPEIESLAEGAGTSRGTGGMVTKLAAARIAGMAGIPTVVAGGADVSVLKSILDGNEIGTLFCLRRERLA